jgi:hypothetical protein
MLSLRSILLRHIAAPQIEDHLRKEISTRDGCAPASTRSSRLISPIDEV